jgi:glycosyltransferase involved in cell wall biosynthesis
MNQIDSHPAVEAGTVAVIIPCLNEAHAVREVVTAFRAALPGARIIVVDNGSTDGTGNIARGAGAHVVTETRRGKGFALNTGFRHAASADTLLMVDGDGTYPAAAAPQLLACIENGADMAVGTRLRTAGDKAFPIGHSFGNRAFNAIVRLLFGLRTEDLFSGYRAMTARFVAQCPLVAQGFEVEAELSIHASVSHFRVDYVPVAYAARTGDDNSKLRTLPDGMRILLTILRYFRDYRPIAFFGLTALVLFAGSFVTGSVVVEQYLATGLVLRIPLAICAVALFILGALSMTAGVLLSSINRRTEEIRALLASRRL